MPMIFSNFNSNCSNLVDMRNLQEQVKKAFCYQKLFWPFTAWINCSSDLKILQILGLQSRISKGFPDHENNFFLTVCQNNFANKMPFTLQVASENDQQLPNFSRKKNYPPMPLDFCIQLWLFCGSILHQETREIRGNVATLICTYIFCKYLWSK